MLGTFTGIALGSSEQVFNTVTVLLSKPAPHVLAEWVPIRQRTVIFQPRFHIDALQSYLGLRGDPI